MYRLVLVSCGDREKLALTLERALEKINDAKSEIITVIPSYMALHAAIIVKE